MIFKNRAEAGQHLAERLSHLSNEDCCVLALPRGGVPIAARIARRIGGELNLLLVKKVGAPLQPELAIGAVTDTGEQAWNNNLLRHLGISKEEAEEMATAKLAEAGDRWKTWRAICPPPQLEGRTAVLVDDGLATGATMMAAIEVVRKKKPARIVVAVPVAPVDTTEEIGAKVDEIVVLAKPPAFGGVGQWYHDFTQVEDDEVTRLLEEAQTRAEAEPETLMDEIDEPIEVTDGTATLPGHLTLPADARALVIFAHGSGSTHRSPRNLKVASALQRQGFGTLLFDLLSEREALHRANVFDIPLLTRRLSVATEWARKRLGDQTPPIAYFGASTGAAAAIGAAADDPSVFSVISRGGRADLAGEALTRVQAPVLLIVGSEDQPVIELNEKASQLIPNSQLVIVAGAGHLFEEKGTLEEVTEYASDWLEDCLILIEGSEAAEDEPRPDHPQAEERVLHELHESARPLSSEEEIRIWLESLSQSKIVMFGEATHGTEEFYRIRRTLSERLIREHGFSFIAVEGDWTDCYALNRYLIDGTGGSAREVMAQFKRWPTWMWANLETEAMIEGLKGTDARFYGLDVYSLFESLEVLKRYADRLPEAVADRIHRVHLCFQAFKGNEISYARSLVNSPAGCEQEALDSMRSLLRLRLEETRLNEEELFDARQNAQIIEGAERYYRSMIFGGPESWNLRDRHMLDTLDALLRKSGENAKAIVWAHNSHVGDYHATDMVTGGYVNLGGIAREKYGMDEVRLVGFGTYEGDVIAAQAWGSEPQVMHLQPAVPGSYEAYLHETARMIGETDLLIPKLDRHRYPSLTVERGHRATGVVYREADEARAHNYVPTSLSERYDSFIFVDQTHALRTLPSERRPGLIPETWPAGH